MHKHAHVQDEYVRNSNFRLEVASREELRDHPCWRHAFADERKDHRYYELIEDTLHPEFDYRYFVLKDADGEPRAVEPFFVLDQDMLSGTDGRLYPLVEKIRKIWPRFLKVRTIMIGCVAGEGHLAGGEHETALARHLAVSAVEHARAMGAPMIVMKEFPSRYRPVFECFVANGFSRIPSMPMTRLWIAYENFEQYMNSVLSSKTRRRLRKKFRAAENAGLQMSRVKDVTPVIDEIYPLYLAVFERSNLSFEKLTPDYFCELGQRMSDKVDFFLWRLRGKIVAFAACMTHGDTIYSEYIGLDYSVALDLGLYYYLFRDIVRWGISHGYRWFRSSSLNYDPKFHLRHRLEPIDLYVRHVSPAVYFVMKWLLPLLEPTRYDKTLTMFSNYHELWAERRH